mgnify:CR=1 FL=1
MNFLRNPEVVKTLCLQIFIAVSAIVVAFIWEQRFGVFTFVFTTLLLLTSTVSTYIRYKRIYDLSADIDRILHGNDMNLSFDKYHEGELAVLQSEIHKMTMRLREQRQQLEDDKRYLANALADISHQVRTPLTSINLLVGLLSEPNIPDERRRKLTHELLDLLLRIDWLITTLLKISKLDAGTVRFQQETISLNELIRKATDSLLIPIEIKEQNLYINANGNFTGDVSWTVEAISNIVKNCVEHTPNGGEIRIEAGENSLFAEIVISDSGSGIAQEDLPHIFERFYKSKNVSDKNFGIGLSLARMIIINQNGVIKAENNVTKGALFTIRFYKGTV